MAIHFTFAASKTPKSVPCVGNSISLIELKDAIAAPLVAALRGKKLREKFDFRIYDADTKEEIVGASARVRRNASVLVKRVPAYVVSQQNQLPVVSSQGLKVVNKCAENVVDDDGFGEDVFSNFVVSTLTTVSSDEVESVRKESKKSSKKEENVSDGVFREGVYSRRAASVVSCEEGGVLKETGVSRNEESGSWNESMGDIPEELMCTLCKHIMKDPMLIPCCCNSFCHNCIKVALLGEKKCPNCESSRCNDVDLLPNRHLKSLVDVFFKSNPSVSSRGSCSSQTTSSQVFVDDLQSKSSHKTYSNQDTHVSESIGSRSIKGSIGKRKRLIIPLSNDSKRTKVLNGIRKI